MAYDKFNILTQCTTKYQCNVDTDQIIPARFLKATKREAFENLFRDWRYNADDNSKADLLNDATYSDHI
jgi:3-isopropylmalate/(R)-2-methylmalate dehydratase small subunit